MCIIPDKFLTHVIFLLSSGWWDAGNKSGHHRTCKSEGVDARHRKRWWRHGRNGCGVPEPSLERRQQRVQTLTKTLQEVSTTTEGVQFIPTKLTCSTQQVGRLDQTGSTRTKCEQKDEHIFGVESSTRVEGEVRGCRGKGSARFRALESDPTPGPVQVINTFYPLISASSALFIIPLASSRHEGFYS